MNMKELHKFMAKQGYAPNGEEIGTDKSTYGYIHNQTSERAYVIIKHNRRMEQ